MPGIESSAANVSVYCISLEGRQHRPFPQNEDSKLIRSFARSLALHFRVHHNHFKIHFPKQLHVIEMHTVIFETNRSILFCPMKFAYLHS